MGRACVPAGRFRNKQPELDKFRAARRVNREEIRTARTPASTGHERTTMPLYEYDCRKCKKRFTMILRMAELDKTKSVRCPRCSSTDVQKVIEPFFAVTSKKS